MIDKCPACCREFRALEDYPIIKITGFERLEIPEPILQYPPISFRVVEKCKGIFECLFKKRVKENEKGFVLKTVPEEIAALFDNSDKIELVYNGFVCKKTDFGEYTVAKDCTRSVRALLESEEFKSELGKLEDLVGKEIETGELLRKSFPIGWDISTWDLGLPPHPILFVHNSYTFDSFGGRNPDDQIIVYLQGRLAKEAYTLSGETYIPHININIGRFKHEGRIHKLFSTDENK